MLKQYLSHPCQNLLLVLQTNPNDVAQTALSTTDPYNNKTTTNTIPGYHVKDFEIEITIQNQQYPSIINGNSSNVYYLIQSKGHFVNWTDYYTIDSIDNLSVQSNSEYTKLLYSANTYLPGDQVDFRIKAVLGYTYTSFLPDHIAPIPVRASFYETSDWSTTPTLVMPDTSNPNQISPFLPILVSAIILLLAIAAVFLLVHKRHKKMHLANML
jgi:hypothetical protein